MRYKIALITSKFFRPYIERAVNSMKEEVSFTFYEYSALSELPQLYQTIKEQYDGVCTTGIIPYEIIHRSCNVIDKPFTSIKSRIDEYYRAFFILQNQNKGIDFSRVVLDASISTNQENTRSILDLFGEDFALDELRESTYGSLTQDKLLRLIPDTIEAADALWHTGRIDMVLCKFSSVAQELERRGIPCAFIYPSILNIVESLENFLREIELLDLSGKLQGIILVTSKDLCNSDYSEINFDNVKMQKCLLDFSKESTTDFLIQRSSYGFEIFTSQKTIDRLTRHYSICPLASYIATETGFSARIGYGIGQDVGQARSNAIQAHKSISADGQSCLMSEDGTLLRLSANPQYTINESITTDLTAAAAASGLSILTLQRILTALESLHTDQITTQELATILKVTVANANRFLNSLLKSGLAEVVSIQKAGIKGRPSRVYRICLTK